MSRIAKKYGGQYSWNWEEDKKVFTAHVIFDR
ncbi:MAG: hypothetical protein IKW76_10100 [Clostridia bacterium]|nr:hypothetical protein [Clostridia bacterium]